jgi:hypothetical protein
MFFNSFKRKRMQNYKNLFALVVVNGLDESSLVFLFVDTTSRVFLGILQGLVFLGLHNVIDLFG